MTDSQILCSEFTYVVTLQNPCDAAKLKKLFRPEKPIHWDILDKEVIDEIIFRTIQTRNCLNFELMAKGGMRIGEVFNLVASEVSNQKVSIRDPQSGKEHEAVFIPKRLAERSIYCQTISSQFP